MAPEPHITLERKLCLGHNMTGSRVVPFGRLQLNLHPLRERKWPSWEDESHGLSIWTLNPTSNGVVIHWWINVIPCPRISHCDGSHSSQPHEHCVQLQIQELVKRPHVTEKQCFQTKWKYTVGKIWFEALLKVLCKWWASLKKVAQERQVSHS